MKHDYHWQQEHLKEYKSKIAFAEAYSEHMLKEYIAECNKSRSAREKEVKELESKLLKEKCTTRHLAIREVEREEQAVKQKKRITELEAEIRSHHLDELVKTDGKFL